MARKRGRPPGSGSGAERVEARILDSACELFYQHGLHAVGIERVLDKAGAAKASLYAHYASKDELVAAYLQRLSGEWQQRVNEAVATAGGDGRAGLRRLFDLLEEWTASPEFRGCPFRNAASELPDPAHPGRKVARTHRLWLQGLVRDLVDAAGVRDPSRISRAIVVLMDGAATSALLDGDTAAVESARYAMEQLLSSTPVAHEHDARRKR